MRDEPNVSSSNVSGSAIQETGIQLRRRICHNEGEDNGNALSSSSDSSGARHQDVTHADCRPSAAATTTEGDDLIWGDFDRRQSSVLVTPSSSAIIEVHQYVEDLKIGRHEDPLAWWKGRQSVYPNFARMARKYLCMVATSVPSERMF